MLLCLIPALFIAGAISVFLSKESVMRYLGRGARKSLAYGVASVSGSILAVCSCTILPLFAGIYRMGAGLGPATTFLYAGPAINILAIVLTATVLGAGFGVARALLAISFGLVIGVAMSAIFRREERAKAGGPSETSPAETGSGLAVNSLLLGGLVLFLVFANWNGGDGRSAVFASVAAWKWPLALASLALAALAFFRWKLADGPEWLDATWTLSKQILPLLFVGIIVSGLLFGTPSGQGIVPREWITEAVGGNGLGANFVASVSGALMYFATLTEIPILDGLMSQGMGEGPAMALLLAGPAVSLPSLIVIRSVMGTRKTLTFALLVVTLATIAGKFFGMLYQTGPLQ